jgi:hypothetical protein
VNKFITNLVVALSAFLIGLASASALNQYGSSVGAGLMAGAKSDAMGNVCDIQD